MNICQWSECSNKIKKDPTHKLCWPCYVEDGLGWDLDNGFLDRCQGCNKLKYEEDEFCNLCFDKREGEKVKAEKSNFSPFAKEYSPAWDKKDKDSEVFYVYILELNNGNFYAGQTRELRERLYEHRRGNTKSTKGLSPELVWFSRVPTRESAAEFEQKLKQLIVKDPREVARMIIRFQDLIKELKK